MRRTTRIFLLVFFLLGLGLFENLLAEPDRAESVSGELEKTRQMAAIWKDHVRTLTKERDTAYQEIETLRAQLSQSGGSGRVLKKGEVEVQALAQNQATYQQLQQNFQLQEERLREALAQKQSADRRIEELTAQSSARSSTEVNNEIQDLKYQMERLRYENERLKLSEKELDSLQSQIGVFRTESQQAQKLRAELAALRNQLSVEHQTKDKIEAAYLELQRQYDAQQKETQEILSKFDRLEKRNEDLQNKQTDQAETIESLKASLQSNLAEAERLRSNFESSLQSLIQSFDEKQRQS